MSKKYHLLVFIGRFQPLHLGHTSVISKALELADNVLVLVGSSFQPRTEFNPWSFVEREDMIYRTFPYESIHVEPIRDYPYNDNLWASEVRAIIREYSKETDNVGLIGHEKDHTSYYLKMFPELESESVPNFQGLNATDIRNEFIKVNMSAVGHPDMHRGRKYATDIPWSVLEFITTKDLPREFYAEHEINVKYRKQFEGYPYPPIFHTVDNVVIQSGHVLLVERKAAPGIGLFALPGGFLNVNETLVDGAIRELKEETRLKVPEKVLRGSIVGRKTFDYPKRSVRGRTITEAFHIDLGMDITLPKVKGSDDAKKAFWLPLSELNTTSMFEDHYHIISYFTNV